ncbi:MAG: hypothetical protein IJD01_07540 [Clostridia bacterium]|nr:hypothetical protein [Clostridia bacterium]
MTRSSMKFLKGMGLGLAAGCVAGITGVCYMKRHRKGMKRNVSKALRNMSELVDSVNHMF